MQVTSLPRAYHVNWTLWTLPIRVAFRYFPVSHFLLFALSAIITNCHPQFRLITSHQLTKNDHISSRFFIIFDGPFLIVVNELTFHCNLTIWQTAKCLIAWLKDKDSATCKNLCILISLLYPDISYNNFGYFSFIQFTGCKFLSFYTIT